MSCAYKDLGYPSKTSSGENKREGATVNSSLEKREAIWGDGWSKLDKIKTDYEIVY